MNTAPLIGVSGSITKDETQHFLLRDYMRAVIAGGGVPVLLSPDLTDALLDACLAHLGGLLLAGGNDASPALFGEAPIEQLGEVNPLRDQFEVRLLRKAVALRMPVLGVCRGVQIMTVALGGTLWQDLASQYRAPDGKPPIAHRQTCPGHYPSHEARIVPDTRLAALLGGEALQVNSFHHQAVRDTAPGMRVSALAPDGVIEAVEHETLPFFLGVQWHPERAFASDARALKLFSELARQAAIYLGA